MGLGKGRLVLLKGSVTIASLWASVACWDWRSRTKIPDLIHRLRGFFMAYVLGTKTPKYHPREWVVHSDPFYSNSESPVESHPTVVGGLFKCCLEGI